MSTNRRKLDTLLSELKEISETEIFVFFFLSLVSFIALVGEVINKQELLRDISRCYIM